MGLAKDASGFLWCILFSMTILNKLNSVVQDVNIRFYALAIDDNLNFLTLLIIVWY